MLNRVGVGNKDNAVNQQNIQSFIKSQMGTKHVKGTKKSIHPTSVLGSNDNNYLKDRGLCAKLLDSSIIS